MGKIVIKGPEYSNRELYHNNNVTIVYGKWHKLNCPFTYSIVAYSLNPEWYENDNGRIHHLWKMHHKEMMHLVLEFCLCFPVYSHFLFQVAFCLRFPVFSHFLFQVPRFGIYFWILSILMYRNSFLVNNMHSTVKQLMLYKLGYIIKFQCTLIGTVYMSTHTTLIVLLLSVYCLPSFHAISYFQFPIIDNAPKN